MIFYAVLAFSQLFMLHPTAEVGIVLAYVLPDWNTGCVESGDWPTLSRKQWEKQHLSKEKDKIQHLSPHYLKIFYSL